MSGLGEALAAGVHATMASQDRAFMMSGTPVDCAWLTVPKVEIKDHQSFGPKWHRFAVTVADLVVWTGDDPRDVPTEKYRELLEYVLYSAPSGTMSLGQMIRIMT